MIVSPLATQTRISPFRNSPRNHAIDTITVHCTAGRSSIEGLGSLFQTNGASCNYGIGEDGRIICIAPEEDRSWCSSNPANDHRAVTIEASSDSWHPYAINDKVWQSLIKLCADICKRNNITKLIWSNNAQDRINHRNGVNMTCHRDYANKSCPGDYIYNRLGLLAQQVNKILEGEDEMTYEDFKKFMAQYEDEKRKMAASDWAQPALDYVAKEKIMVGDNGGLHPRSNITRQEVAQIFYNMHQNEENTKANQTVHDWAQESWDKAVELGIFDGTYPRNPLTREQAATVFNRMKLMDEDNKE